ncbi:MAG TPA: pyruvate kinase [Candidatus Dormibacteraeota bacterium]|nr:pyruvate kinase [Candidatus Dormibacteraeota bacterium]
MEQPVAFKRTKIVATIGPASRRPETLRAMIAAGVNVFRLNFSHGTREEHAAAIADVRRIAADLGTYIAILQDLPGPKVRTGDLADGIAAVHLEPGARFTLTTEPAAGDAGRVSVSYDGLPADVEPGTDIFLADGAIQLRILETTGAEVRTEVVRGGDLRPRQGINYPAGTLRLESVTERDFEHLAFGLEHEVDWVALSFVRTPRDVARVKAFIEEHHLHTPVLAKIEKHEALDHIDEIIAAADGIMVARGDLGIEIPLEQVPMIQKDLIMRANRASKPVITATQMLESMVRSARPTRAEAADVANAILDGTDAVMLSGETARGDFPVEAVRVMAEIAREVERNYPHEKLGQRRLEGSARSVEIAIAESAARVTEQLGLRLVVTGTTTGNTARHISSFRPHARIIALTPRPHVARRLALFWGVDPLPVQSYRYFETLIELAEERLKQERLVEPGEIVAITSGMPVGEGGTNVLKLHAIS